MAPTDSASSKLREMRGQSLVEVALFFPIFIIMLGGLVEVGSILLTQNRVTSATRSGTRFAANGGEDGVIPYVVLHTVTQTLRLDESVWDIWSIRGTIDEEGLQVVEDSWQFNHVYGGATTIAASSIDEEEIQTEIIAQLGTDENGGSPALLAAGIDFVGTLAIHDINSILGLDAVPQFAGITSIQELVVMRRIGFDLEASDGCTAFPLAVSEGVRSANSPGSSIDPFPEPADFEYPALPPSYAGFFGHRPNVQVRQGQEGYVYLVDTSDFEWLIWNESIIANDDVLANSLTWPGNALDYSNHGDEGNPLPGSGYPYVVRGFMEAGDPTDVTIHRGDRAATYALGPEAEAVRTVLEDHVDKERSLRLVSWTEPVSDDRLLMNGFPIFKIVGFNLSEDWLLLELFRWDESCGQLLPG